MSRLGFLQRLTAEERATLRNIDTAGTDSVVSDFFYLFGKAEDVNLDDSTLNQGLQYFVSKGYLTSDRVALILS